MRDVTSSFRKYRDLVRHVYNVYARDLPDYEMDFPDLDRALFRGIFLAAVTQAEVRPEPISDRDVFLQFAVVATGKIMVADEGSDSINWRYVDVGAGDLTLSYIWLFDFAWTDLDREFEFIECYVRESKSDDVASGQRVLVAAAASEIFADGTVQDWHPSWRIAGDTPT
jgi:hypothetical protein